MNGAKIRFAALPRYRASRVIKISWSFTIGPLSQFERTQTPRARLRTAANIDQSAELRRSVIIARLLVITEAASLSLGLLSQAPHRVPDKDPVTKHVSPLVTRPEKLIAVVFPATDPVKVPLPVPIADAKVNEPMRSLPAVAVPENARLTILIPVNVPAPVNTDPFWLLRFTVDEIPTVPLFDGF